MAGHTNHTANAAAWAAMRAEEAAAMEQRRAERAAAKEARRAANRAAWWGRMGKAVPGESPEVADAPEVAAPEAPRLSGFKASTPSQGLGMVETFTKDGLRYGIERDGESFMVHLPNCEIIAVPTYTAACEIVAMAHEVATEEAAALPAFKRGMTFAIGAESYTVEGVGCTVKFRNARPGAKLRGSVRRFTDRGECITLNAGSKTERTIYAADLAA